MDRSLQKAKNMKILVAYVNANQRVTSAEELFNNQVDRTTSLFPQPFLSSPRGSMNSVAILQRWTMSSTSQTSITEADLAIDTADARSELCPY